MDMISDLNVNSCQTKNLDSDYHCTAFLPMNKPFKYKTLLYNFEIIESKFREIIRKRLKLT